MTSYNLAPPSWRRARGYKHLAGRSRFALVWPERGAEHRSRLREGTQGLKHRRLAGGGVFNRGVCYLVLFNAYWDNTMGPGLQPIPGLTSFSQPGHER